MFDLIHRARREAPRIVSHQGYDIYSTKQHQGWNGRRCLFTDGSWVDFASGVMYAAPDNPNHIKVVRGRRSVHSQPGLSVSFADL